MGSFLCQFSASVFRGRFSAFVASLLIAVFLIPGEALAAPKPLTASAVQTKVVKRGVNGWIGVEEKKHRPQGPVKPGCGRCSLYWVG